MVFNDLYSDNRFFLKKFLYRKYKIIREFFLIWINFILQGKPNLNEKIFIVSLNKSGTTALTRHLVEMGYKQSSQPYYELLGIRDNFGQSIIKALRSDKSNVFQDVPFFSLELIPLLLQNFPHAKFIYINRDVNKWCKSFINYYKIFYLERPNYRERYWIPRFLKNHYLIEDINSVNEKLLHNFFLEHKTQVRALMDGYANYLELDLADETSLRNMYLKLRRNHIQRSIRVRNKSSYK